MGNMMTEFKTTDPSSDLHWQKVIALAFRLFDTNHDGYIDKKEFRWMTTSAVISPKTIKTVFERCDLDKDGKLDYSEFRDMVTRYKERKQIQVAKSNAEKRLRNMAKLPQNLSFK